MKIVIMIFGLLCFIWICIWPIHVHKAFLNLWRHQIQLFGSTFLKIRYVFGYWICAKIKYFMKDTRSVSDFFCCWSKTGTVILTSNWLQKWERKNIHFNYHKIFWSIKCWVWYNLLKNHNRIINPFIHVLINPSVTISI